MSIQDYFMNLFRDGKIGLLTESTAIVSWIKPAVGTLAAIVVFGVGILFPLQVKLQAPEATLSEIYATLWDCLVDFYQVESPSYRKISSDELVALLNSTSRKDKVLVVDTRTYQDFRNGHIKGSVFLPFNEFRAEYQTLPKDQTIVLTCQFGHYSVVATNKLLAAGYSNVLDYAAGMEEWTNLKLPLVEGMVESDLVVSPKKTGALGSTDTGHGSLVDADGLAATVFPKTGKRRVYLDYNATTPLDPRVLESMMPYLTHEFGNAASRTHRHGQTAEAAVYKARQEIAQSIHASSSDEIVFTSGASESNNLALKGLAFQARNKAGSTKKKHIITCVTEHKAVLDTCKYLESEGFEVTYLGVRFDGRIDLDEFEKAIRPGQTFLASIMLANNEIGTIQPFREIGKLCRSHGILFHTDGTQGVGKIDLQVERDFIDLMSISAHKIYGPKGVGALYIRSGIDLVEQISGGGHEGGRRSGTLNVPGIVGLGCCCILAEKLRPEESKRQLDMRNLLQEKIKNAIPSSHVNGSMEHRLAGNLHMSFEGVTSEEVLMELGSDVAISSGSACNSRKTGPSHVLVALDLPPERMSCTLRFGIGRFTSYDDIDFVAHRLNDAIVEVTERRGSKKLL